MTKQSCPVCSKSINNHNRAQAVECLDKAGYAIQNNNDEFLFRDAVNALTTQGHSFSFRGVEGGMEAMYIDDVGPYTSPDVVLFVLRTALGFVQTRMETDGEDTDTQ